MPARKTLPFLKKTEDTFPSNITIRLIIPFFLDLMYGPPLVWELQLKRLGKSYEKVCFENYRARARPGNGMRASAIRMQEKQEELVR